MDIFILYLFVCSLYLVESANVLATTRQEGPVSSYLGAEKTAKLLSFIQKMRENEKNYPFRSGRSREGDEIEKKDPKVPSVIESMKLLQKNYDTGKKYDAEHSARKFNVQVISNPEVLELYKQQNARKNGEVNSTGRHHAGGVRIQVISNPEVLDAYRSMHARRQGESEISFDRQREYGEEVKRNSRISMHFLKKPEGMDFRRSHKKVKPKSKSTSDSTSNSDNEDISIESSSDSDFRRSIVHFRVDEDLDNAEYSFNHNSDDVTDVTLKPEEAFDIVKPFIVEIFNKLKENNAAEAKDDDPKSDDDDFYDPKKVPSSAASSAENTKKIIKLNLNDITTKRPAQIWSQYTVPHEIEKEDESPLTNLKNDYLPFPTTPDQVELDDSWRKKEKVKKIFMNENISGDKTHSRETRGRNNEDNDWRSKKLPASKKSFVEPTLTHEDTWGDKGYGYWKKNNWEKKDEKDSSNEKHKNNKKSSMEDTRDMGKKNKRNDSKERKKLEGSKSEEVWNKPKKVNDWEKSRMKKDDWDSPKKKKDDWDSPKKKNDDWDSPQKKKDDWDSPKKKDDDWDSPKKKLDDWDKPKKEVDDWDSPKKKNDDWDSPKKKNDDWDSPKKKLDDWDSPKKKINDWDSPKKQNDDWDKPKKKNDDWDQPKSKHNDWDKEDNWNKKKDSYNKKDNDWGKKNLKLEKTLPDNKKRDKGWDMVGLDDGKNTGGSKKKSLYSEWGNYESFRNTKDKSKEKETYKEMKVEDYKDDVKPKKKSEWDSYIPKYNYDAPRKAKTYDSYEKRPGNSGGGFGSGFGGRTSIPIVGKKSVYAD